MLDQRGPLLRAAVGFAGCSTRSSDHALGKQHNLKVEDSNLRCELRAVRIDSLRRV